MVLKLGIIKDRVYKKRKRSSFCAEYNREKEGDKSKRECSTFFCLNRRVGITVDKLSIITFDGNY